MGGLRLFVAADVPAAAVAAATAAAEPFLTARGARPIARGSHHVTVRFLGEVAEVEVGGIAEVLRAATSAVAPGVARLHGLGTFPIRGPSANVLWAGVTDGRTLVDLAARLGDLPGDDRPLHPHVTLCRFPRSVALGDLPGGDFGDPFPLTAVRLIRSRLGGDGPRYETLRDFPLGG